MIRAECAPEPTPLLRLCRHRRWAEVEERLQSRPSEAAPVEASLRGEKPTILACALRIGAPYRIIEALIQADRRQLGVCHRLAGSVVHEALRSMAADDIFSLVFTEALRHQDSLQQGYRQSNRGGVPQFQCVHVQENHRVVQAPNIFHVQDDLGRTVLHQIVEQVLRRRTIMGRPPGSTFHIFKQIVKVHPDLVHTTDSDGNTPLVLLLSQHCERPDSILEDEIFEMLTYLTTQFPSTVSHVRRLSRPWRFMNLPLHSITTRLPAPSPLYFAVLYGRRYDTISALLQVDHQSHDNGCASVATHHGELCLHVAVTLRAPLDVLRLLVQAYPRAVHAADIYGLTPVDWLWITHVIDQNTGPGGTQMRLSRRRHVGRDFREWHELVSDRIPYEADRFDFLDKSTVVRMQKDFLARLQVMLSPHLVQEEGGLAHTNGLLPLVCRIHNLPVGILKLVLAMDPLVSSDATQPDASGSYPLHHLAAHTRGYTVSLPLGVTSRVQSLTETKENLAVGELVDRFPEVCRAFNKDRRLPLHVAIDTAKLDRSSGEAGSDDEYTRAVLEALLETHPEALGQRDGITHLFPWQQAAAGPGACLDTVYDLLRREPALLTHVANQQY